MRHSSVSHSLLILLGVILTCSGSAQTPRQLLGKLVKGDDPSPAAAAATPAEGSRRAHAAKARTAPKRARR